ncbi:MAG: hypothetical protein ACHREM_09110 [Polyangiales bacterium]
MAAQPRSDAEIRTIRYEQYRAVREELDRRYAVKQLRDLKVGDPILLVGDSPAWSMTNTYEQRVVTRVSERNLWISEYHGHFNRRSGWSTGRKSPHRIVETVEKIARIEDAKKKLALLKEFGAELDRYILPEWVLAIYDALEPYLALADAVPAPPPPTPKARKKRPT